jgi:SAM-dependent methyltransferase
MRQFIRAESFDLAINMYTSFGYFDDKNEDIAVLKNVIDSLRPGGKFLMELASKEWLAKVYQPTTSEETEDGGLLIQRHEIIDDWSRIRNEWIVVKDGRAITFQFHHTIYSAQELKDRLDQVGFKNVHAFGDLSGGAYDIESERLVVLAEKPRIQKGDA